MFRLFLLSVCFLSLLSSSFSQNWVNTLGSTNIDQAHSIARDAAGNSYIVGFFSETMALDDIGSQVLSSAGSRDVFFAKYDANGTLEWARGIGGSDSDEGKDIAIDNSGNIYILGEFSGFVDFDPTIGIALQQSSSATDIFLAQYDASGTFVRVTTMAGSGTDLASNLEIDNNGDLYISGLFSGLLDFVAGSTTDNLFTTENSAAFMAKFSATGSYIWSKKIESSGGVVINDLELDNNNNLYATGSFGANTDFNPNSNTTNTLTLSGNTDAFLAKYNTNGAYLWAKAIQGIDLESSENVEITQDGNVVIAGYFQNSIDLNPSASNHFVTATGQRDVFFANYSPNGAFRWGKHFGSSGNEYCYGLATDNQRRVFLAGTFQGTTDVNPDQNQTASLTSNGDADIFFARFDSVGNYEWSMSAGGSNGDLVQDIEVDNILQIHATGWYQGSSSFFGNSTLTSQGDRDILIAKVNSAMSSSTRAIEVWTDVKVFPNPIGEVLLLQNLDVYLSGSIDIRLTDLAGRVVFHAPNREVEENVMLSLPSFLSNGIYFLQVYQNNALQQTFKVLK